MVAACLSYAQNFEDLLLDRVFSTTDAARVFAPIYSDNLRSRAFAEKLGMQLEGVLRSSCERNGQRKDQAIYSVLRETG